MADQVDHDDAPELDDAFFARAKPMRDVLPKEAQAAFKPRGAQKRPTKVRTAVRLDPRITEHFKALSEARGRPWQTLMNDALVEVVEKAERA